MPRYFFNVHDGVNLPDHVGMELRDLTAAKRKAIEVSAQYLGSEPAQFWDGDEWSLDVCDSTNLILFTLQFVATMAPAVRALGP